MDNSNVICVIPVDQKDRLPGTEHLKYTPSAGMTHIACEACQCNCWVGPKQLQLKSTFKDMPIICLTCLVKKADRPMSVESLTG